MQRTTLGARESSLNPDRYFDPDPLQRAIARELYTEAGQQPLICPHSHIDPRLFADAEYSFGTPVDLLIIPDHYVLRLLYSQGISLESLGIPSLTPSTEAQTFSGTELAETDHRRIWQLFADHYYLFRGTPTGVWLDNELAGIFGVEEKLTAASAQRVYDQIAAKLALPEFKPRAMFERFNIEVLCTTDAATDPLRQHAYIKHSGWRGNIRPTFRPDGVINLDAPGWRTNIDALSSLSGIDVHDYASLIQALENRRAFFKAMGAAATDHAALTPYTHELTPSEANTIFRRALQGQANAVDARRFTGHMLLEMARMCIDDGLVMQLHPGSFRNHNGPIFDRFGPDKGADIPIAAEYTQNLLPLLNKYGNDPRLTLILFTLDESTYSRELAPLAGHYPALRLGPPWWFFDSFNGMVRYFDQVMETAGLYNTCGFNDDTRAFPSIPARHDVWRRAGANWLAGLTVRHFIDMADAREMLQALAIGLAKQAYHL